MLLIVSYELIASRTYSVDCEPMQANRYACSRAHRHTFKWQSFVDFSDYQAKPKWPLLYHNILLVDLCVLAFVVDDRVVVIFDKIIIHVAICVRACAVLQS